MNLPILTAVLLGLVLTPALADYSQQKGNNCQVSVGGVFQNLTLSSQTRVVVIEQRSEQFSWKTIWNYNTGIIATKLVQERTCYISIMNRNEMPSFENLVQLASQNRNQIGFGTPTKTITFVTNGLVNNLRSYGADVFSMCSGLTTYMAHEVPAFQGPQVNLGTCFTLNVLSVVQLQYCNSNGNWNGNWNHSGNWNGSWNGQWNGSWNGNWNGSWNDNGQSQQIPGGDGSNQVIIGGQSQIVTINRQWHVAIIEQTSISGSWKTIWNYNTGVIATKVTQQNICYISIMNRNEMPSFNNLARLAQESRNQIGFGRPTKKITFVTNGLVNNLRSYGADVFSMCSGLTTYMAHEVHGVQVTLGSCITLDVLRVVDLKYCTGNGQSQQIPGNIHNNTQVIIGGQSQIVTINRQWHVAIIEQTSISGSWKTIWNYNTGVIATKVTQQNICYISIMNRNEMPSFNNLARLAQESRNQIGFGRPTKKITFVTNGLVNNLRSYGADVFSMCSGLTTYMAHEVHGVQVTLGSCITLDVLRVVDLKYCTGNGQSQQIPGNIHNNTQVIIGGQSQIVTINRQWHVAIIEQTSISGSWKTIWNYNTGVIATKVTQQNICYISIMNRNEMPSFNNLARLAQESRNQIGFGRPTKKITFVTNGLVNNLRSYGADVFSMCSGLTTYMAHEVHGVQVTLGSCITLDVLRVVDLKYCTGNGQSQQIPGNIHNNTQVIIGGQSQIVTINRQWHVAIIEQTSISGSWKTIWNYNTGVIATKVTQQNICYISIMNRNEMPSFNNLARLAQESRNQIGFGRPTKKITFVTNGLVNNLRSYGADVFSMCSGLTTYMAHEVHGVQVTLGSCITLDVLRVVDLKYCTGNGQSQQIPGNIHNNTQVIIGGQSQIVTINRQWHVAIIEQTSISGSWKTIWNYNTGVIATKVTQQNICYISIMNRNEMPSFNNLARLAQESRNQIGFGRPTKKITFVTNGLVNNLRSYGADVFSMCSGLTTYMAHEVHGVQVTLGSCITLDVLRVVDLKYCTVNGQSQQIPGNIHNNTQVIIGGQSQIVTINRQWHVAIIEQTSISGSWKTIWNYNTGVIATKVTQQNICYISIMNRNEMPSFNNLARLAQESRNQIGFGRPTKKITFVTNGLVNNLRSYGADVFSMCSGLTTYMAHEVHGVQVTLGSCITLDVLRVVDLKYCTGNGQSQQIPGNIHNNTQVIIGGQSQIVTINRQWHVAIIEQTSISGSWKTIWNYNTGVIATKVTQQNICYISIMNRNEMPSFNNLARLAQESRNQIGFGRPTKTITFVTNGLVNNLRSYGADVFSMCSGLTTYMAHEVRGVQVTLGSCITLDVLRVVDLKYCTVNGQSQQIPGNIHNNTQVIIGGQSQIVTINRQWHVAIIEQTSISGSWKTIWNYNTGVIATKVTQQNICYISIMNRNEMPSFNNLARLAQESRNQIGFGRPTKKITFVTNGLVNNLRSYGADVFSMCSGLTTYMAHEVHAFQGPQVTLGSCITLDVLGVVDLKYCSGNFNGNGQSQQTGNNCHFSGACVYQNLTLSSQTRVVVIEQRSEQFSWKTIWNYNTGIIASKMVQERTCYISTLNRNEMPSFDALVRYASGNRNQIGFGTPTKTITFVTNGLVNNLRSYGADVFSMCSGLTTYMAHEVPGPQPNQGSCISLDVLKLVDLNYCGGNIKA